MSRNIPPVRRWRVRYYLDRCELAEIIVDAPNRMFAKWAARDRFRRVQPVRYLASNRETVSLAKRESAQ